MACLPPLPRPGDRIAVVAPAGPAPVERTTAGLAALEALGYAPVLFDVPLGPRHYLAGPDVQRARTLERAFASRDYAAVWALRGGFGCIRTLQHVDMTVLRANPKPLFGFSDLTALLDGVVRHAGFATLHAPVVTQLPDLDAPSLQHLAAVLGGKRPALSLDADRIVLRPGCASGALVGGNLSLLASLAGTPMMPVLAGILILEDVGEPCYRVDRMLTQLRLAGALDQVRGLIIGRFTGTAAGEEQAFADLWREAAGWIDGPVVLGAPIGHGSENHAVPLGLPAELDTTADSVAIQWDGS